MINVDELAQVIREVDGDHSFGSAALAEAILAKLPQFAARQPVGDQKPSAWLIHWAHHAGQPEATTSASRADAVSALTDPPRIEPLYSRPPAHAVDLARAIDIMWTWQEQLGGHVFDVRDVARTLTSPDMQAIGVDARACIDATDRNQAIVLAKREILRALTDGQAVQP